jgi:hypothetical protein
MNDKNDERFADPTTDQDPRTSPTTRTGRGACDLDADTAEVPQETPGVRVGDEDNNALSGGCNGVNVNLDGDLLDEATQSGE